MKIFECIRKDSLFNRNIGSVFLIQMEEQIMRRGYAGAYVAVSTKTMEDIPAISTDINQPNGYVI